MIQINNDTLVRAGLGNLADAERNLLLRLLYETLEMRTGLRIAEGMSDDELVAFERFKDEGDEALAFEYLQEHVPNYKDIVSDEWEKLSAELEAAAPQMLKLAEQSPWPVPVSRVAVDQSP